MWKNPDEGLTFEKSALEFLYDVHWIQSLTRLIQRNVIGLFPQVHVRTIYAETRKKSKTAPDPITEAEDTEKKKGFCIKFLERNEIGTKTVWTVSFAANESDDLQGYANTCAIFCLLQTQTRLQGVNH